MMVGIAFKSLLSFSVVTDFGVITRLLIAIYLAVKPDRFKNTGIAFCAFYYLLTIENEKILLIILYNTSIGKF